MRLVAILLLGAAARLPGAAAAPRRSLLATPPHHWDSFGSHSAPAPSCGLPLSHCSINADCCAGSECNPWCGAAEVLPRPSLLTTQRRFNVCHTPQPFNSSFLYRINGTVVGILEASATNVQNVLWDFSGGTNPPFDFSVHSALRAGLSCASLTPVAPVTFAPGTVVDTSAAPGGGLNIITHPSSVKLDCAVVTVPNACVLDGMMSGGSILTVTGSSVDIAGIRFQNGFGGAGGAIDATRGAALSTLSCEFINNSASGSGGGAYSCGSRTDCNL